jgi:hypothetical protein
MSYKRALELVTNASERRDRESDVIGLGSVVQISFFAEQRYDDGE